MLHYVLQTIAFQLAFLLVYELLLKKETFFNTNRAYLIITPVLAMIFPLLKIPMLQAAIPVETLVMLPEVIIGGSSRVPSDSALISADPGTAKSINWWTFAYITGFLFSLGVLFYKLRILKHFFAHKTTRREAEVKIIEVPDSRLACTFFKTIFLGANLSNKEREQILSHELVHVRQKHTLDLIFFEVLKIIFWFNPLVYIYQRRISILHEFLADAGVVKNVEKQDYFRQLLNSAFNTEDISFINQFSNHSIIKKRIVMLQKSKSKSVSKLKLLIILPLMLSMMTYVSWSTSMVQNDPVTQKTTPPPPARAVEVTQVKNVENQTLDIPFAVVEQVPIFPGCESLSTNMEQKDCMTRRITDHVNRNFNTALGKELGLTGVKRIYVQFKISSEGVVTDIRSRAPHPALGEEAERVVGTLPKMEPGLHRGEKVGVLYSLPIALKVPKKEPAEDEKN